MIEKIQLDGSTLMDITTRTWHQCPQLVRNYLDNVTYDPSDYTTSQIANYAPATAVISNTKPIGNTVNGTTYYNEVPNVATPIVSGAVEPLDRLRWINSATANMRDLGGWTCDGGTVKYGMLFRGGAPYGTDKNLMVNRLDVKHELDLRGSSEARGYSVWDIGYTSADGITWYNLTDKETWKINIGCIFDNVTKSIPVFFHCAAGADRTGTLACVLEALLGMSQSDIDKDYELTTFYSGSGSDANARRRNETEWQGLINAIKAVNLEGGLTDSFRNRAVSFVLSLGFTIDEINAFRNAMIDGTPTAITVSMDSYSVTKSGANVTFDSSISSVDEFQEYEVGLSANSGYAISNIVVTMGGTDVTSLYWNGGDKVNLNRSISTTLNYCTSDNSRTYAIDGQSFAMNLTASTGYTLEGATVSITMGGVDVSTYYSNGKIAIPKVTGNIVITATAVPSAPTFSFTMDRPLTGGRTVSGAARQVWAVSPPSENYAFGEFYTTNATQSNAGTTNDICTNMTSNGVNITNSGSNVGVCYPFIATAGKTYTFKWTSAGTPRAHIGWWVDGVWQYVTNPDKNTVGTCTQSFTAPNGTTVWGAFCLGAGSNANAQYTNVSVTEA